MHRFRKAIEDTDYDRLSKNTVDKDIQYIAGRKSIFELIDGAVADYEKYLADRRNGTQSE
jgi:hypothetical protein